MDLSLKRLSKKIFEYQSLISYVIDSYNDFLINGIDDVFYMNPIRYNTQEGEVLIQFSKDYICPPSLGDVKCKGEPMWPFMTRQQKLDYVANLMVNIDFKLNDELIRQEKTFFVYLPVMLGSIIDNLVVHNLKRRRTTGEPQGSLENPKTFADVYECDLDPLGYFIMNGTEKVLVTQEKLATNQVFTLPDKDNSRIVTEMRSESPDTSISLIRVVVTTTKTKNRYLSISLPFVKNKNKEMNIINLIRLNLFLQGDEDSLTTAIDMFESYIQTLTDNEKMMDLVETTVEDARRLYSDEVFVSQILQDFGLAIEQELPTEDETEDDIIEDEYSDRLFTATAEDYDIMRSELRRHFFPHISEENQNSKMMTLALMTVRHMKSYFSYKPLSNRDHYGVKRLETPGILVQTLFGKLFQNFVKDIIENAPKSSDTDFRTVFGLINNRKERINRDLRGSFVKESWGIKGGKQKTGVSQVLSRLSIPATYSYLRRIGTPGNKSSKTAKPRMIDPTQYGVVCPAETPEGEACGLTKNLSVSAYITLQEPTDSIVQLLGFAEEGSLVSDEPTSERQAVLTLNGAYVGYCDGPLVKNLLVQARRQNKIPRHTSVTLSIETDVLQVTQEVKIFTTKGRAVRPLYIVENGQLLLDTKGLRNQNVSFSDLVHAGVVEYVDVTETEYLLIAITASQLSNGKPYTHCEIDPSFMFGVSANVMAFPQHNPVPRVTYTTSMLKQNVSVPVSSYQHRPDTGLKILRYPQKSIVQTDMYQLIGLDQQPGSQMVIVAIMSAGYNQDDAVIVNKAALERGLFNSDAYDIYTVETQKREELVTTEKYPDFMEGIIPLRRPKFETFEKVRSIDEKYTDDEIKRIAGPGGELVQVTQREITGGLVEHDQDRGTLSRPEMEYVYTFRRPVQVENKFEVREIVRDIEQEDLFPEDFERQGGEFLRQERRGDKMVYTVRFPVYITEETPVEQGDVLAVKTITTREGKKVESNTYMTGKRGRVDRIFRKNRGPSNRIVKIRIRTEHLVDIGDKVCAPYAQKGVVGMIQNPEDMPFTEQGITPDILVNPHAFPSRMTIGMLLETLIGKAMTCSSRRNQGPHYIPTTILQSPILNIQGKTYSQLSSLEKDVFIALHLNNSSIMQQILSNQDFNIPDEIANLSYSFPNKSQIRVSDLPLPQAKAYNLLHRAEERRHEEERKEKFCDASAFRRVDMKSVQQELFELGYEATGTEQMFSGKTGRRINARIFMGVCNYMALKHMVEEKFHARDTGRRQPINRQATRGKAKNGGIRFGEMESDAVKAHGGSGVIQSRLRDDSDPYNSFACKRCGQFCYFNSDAEQYTCPMCDDEPQPTRVTIPYSFHMLKNYWIGMGIQPSLEFGESTDLPDDVRRQVRQRFSGPVGAEPGSSSVQGQQLGFTSYQNLLE